MYIIPINYSFSSRSPSPDSFFKGFVVQFWMLTLDRGEYLIVASDNRGHPVMFRIDCLDERYVFNCKSGG